jgi:hypothetical protein
MIDFIKENYGAIHEAVCSSKLVAFSINCPLSARESVSKSECGPDMETFENPYLKRFVLGI